MNGPSIRRSPTDPGVKRRGYDRCAGNGRKRPFCSAYEALPIKPGPNGHRDPALFKKPSAFAPSTVDTGHDYARSLCATSCTIAQYGPGILEASRRYASSACS